jgi:RND superfamily putative drug exporter
MAGRFATENLARQSARKPWLTIGLWVVALLIAGYFSGVLGLNTTTEVKLLDNPESQQGWDALKDHGLRPETPARETVIITSKTADGGGDAAVTVDTPEFRAAVESVTNALRQETEMIDPNSVTNYYELSAQNPDAAQGLVSADRRSTIIPATFVGSLDDALDHGAEYLELLDEQEEALPETLQLTSVGDVSINEEFNTVVEEDLQTGEAIGVPIAFIILIIVFGALLAAVLPIALAIFAIAIAFGLTALVSQISDLSFFVTNMITMIGLAVGIDYSLFIVQRYREERQHGLPKADAIVTAGATASRAVVFSGMTVVLALIGLFLVPNNIYRSLSVGAILVVLVAIVASLTLIPALLGLLGDHINWPRHPHYGTEVVAPEDRYRESAHKGFWGTITRVVMAHPVVSMVLALAILLAAAYPYLDLEDGITGASGLPDDFQAKEGFLILQSDFQAGLVAPVEFVVEGPTDDPAVQAGIDALETQLSEETTADGQNLFGPITVTTSEDGQVTLLSAPLTVDPNSTEAFDAIDHLRDDVVPAVFDGIDNVTVMVTGQTANFVDSFEQRETYTPIVFTFVLGMSFLILLLAFRSIVIPITAIILNLLSVGAAYGLIVLVFQKGYGADFFGFQETPTIESWIPLFLFAVLFGLSMDYQVFLLSRMREHYTQTHRNRESVATGLESTARLITGAAAIMVAVFGGFAAGRMVPLQQMGFGLAVAVLVDATIVRCILVPAIMTLLGDRNWYLPSWLKWLPNLRIEGEPVQPAVAPGSAPAD